MCIVSTPKISNPTPAQDKPLPIIRNPLLDNYSPATSARIGRSALRTDLPVDPAASGYTSPLVAPVIVPTPSRIGTIRNRLNV